MLLGQLCASQFADFTLASSQSSLRISQQPLPDWKKVATERCRDAARSLTKQGFALLNLIAQVTKREGQVKRKIVPSGLAF